MRVKEEARRIQTKTLLAVGAVVIGIPAVVGAWRFYSPYEIIEIPLLGGRDTVVRRINCAAGGLHVPLREPERRLPPRERR